MKRSPLPRSPMKRRRTQRRQDRVDAMREKTKRAEAADLPCELLGDGACWGRCKYHHRFTVARGGSDAYPNLLWCCSGHHADIHDHPEESNERGLLLRAEPETAWERETNDA